MLKVILFFAGLNTYKTDDIHLLFYRLGPYDLHLQKEFERQGFKIHSLPTANRPFIQQQVESAKEFLSEYPKHDKIEYHILTHSMGALTALKLLADYPKLISPASLTLIAPPLQPPHMVKKILLLSQTWFAHFFAWFGYDLSRRQAVFAQLLSPDLTADHLIHRLPDSIFERTLVLRCSVDPAQRTWPLKSISFFTKDLPQPHDGLLELGAQHHPKFLNHTHIELDHLQQLGYMIEGSEAEWKRMISSIILHAQARSLR